MLGSISQAGYSEKPGSATNHLADINNARAAAGAPALTQEACLAQQAQAWANNVAGNDRISRKNKYLTKDVNNACNTHWAFVGENIGSGATIGEAWDNIRLPQDDRVHDSYKKVVSKRWDFVGIGVAQNTGGSGRYYIVEFYSDLFADNIYDGTLPKAGEMSVMIGKKAYGNISTFGGVDEHRIVDAIYNNPKAYITASISEFPTAGWPPKAKKAHMFESTVNFQCPQPWGTALATAYENMHCGDTTGPDDDHYCLSGGTGINASTVDPSAAAIFYDPEPRCHTPSAEKNYHDSSNNSQSYLKSAPGQIRALGTGALAGNTPGTGLASSVWPGYVAAKGQAQNYIDLGFPEASVKNADIYEIQAQGNAPSSGKADVDGWQWLIRSAVMNARAQRTADNKPQIPIYVGISPNPGPSGSADHYDMCIAAMNSHAWVTGYWFTGLGEGVSSENLSEAIEMMKQVQRGYCTEVSNARKQAFYDSTLHAPKCETVGMECDSGALLQAKMAMTPGEPNGGANSLGRCMDGAPTSPGVYHTDRSVDRIFITAPSNFASGVTVTINAEVYAATSTDYIDVYYTSNADAADPTWTQVGTSAQASAAGYKMVTRNAVLTTGSLQAFRVQIRSSTVALSSCAGGVATDHDDLVIAVQ